MASLAHIHLPGACSNQPSQWSDVGITNSCTRKASSSGPLEHVSAVSGEADTDSGGGQSDAEVARALNHPMAVAYRDAFDSGTRDHHHEAVPRLAASLAHDEV